MALLVIGNRALLYGYAVPAIINANKQIFSSISGSFAFIISIRKVRYLHT